MTVDRRSRAAACAGVTAFAMLAILATVPVLAAPARSAATSHRTVWHRLPAIALGLNTAPWDGVYAAYTSAGGGVNVIEPLLRSAGIGLLKYGGGSYADYYDWKTNTNIQDCLPYDTTASFIVTPGGCATSDALGFEQFSVQAKAIGAGSFVTVNFGSATPRLAAAWVSHSRSIPGDGVALWEVGNETYGCWEVNNWLAKPPAKYRGYTPDTYKVVHGVYENPTCPQVRQGNRVGTQTLAKSYAAHALAFLAAMRKAGRRADFGVPWAFGTNVRGASVPFAAEWNNTVLREDRKYIGFVDAHFYPFDFRGRVGGANPTGQQILRSLMTIPSLQAKIRRELRRFVPHARIVVGETGVSPSATTTVCTPVGALFAAGDVLSWLAAGAATVDWWDMNSGANTGARCTMPDVGMFTSGSPPRPETPYYGYLLASALAKPGALLAVMPTSKPGVVLAYQARLPGGGEALAFINTSSRWPERVSFWPQMRLRGELKTLRYSAAGQNRADSRIVAGRKPASSFRRGITLPPQSMVVLESR